MMSIRLESQERKGKRHEHRYWILLSSLTFLLGFAKRAGGTAQIIPDPIGLHPGIQHLPALAVVCPPCAAPPEARWSVRSFDLYASLGSGALRALQCYEDC